MLRQVFLALLLLPHLAVSSVEATETVVLRAGNGRFVRVADDGTLRADAALPGDKATFDLVARSKLEIALKSLDGRNVVPDFKDPRTLRLGVPGKEAGDQAMLQLLPAEGSRFTLRMRGSGIVPALYAKPASFQRPITAAAGLTGTETVAIYRVRPLPEFLQSAVSVTAQALVAKDVAGKEYDQTRTQQTKKYVDLPNPTFKDPKRMKKVQVLATTEEYRVQAHLDGDPEIHIPTMLYLGNYADGGPGMVLVAIDATLPVTGHVSCKVPNLATAKTGYRATIRLAAVVAVGVQRAGNDVTFGPYTVSEMHVSFSKLDLSNDLLEAAHRPIKRFINIELEHNEDRLRQSANRSLEKAMASRAVRLPLLGYLGLP